MSRLWWCDLWSSYMTPETSTVGSRPCEFYLCETGEDTAQSAWSWQEKRVRLTDKQVKWNEGYSPETLGLSPCTFGTTRGRDFSLVVGRKHDMRFSTLLLVIFVVHSIPITCVNWSLKLVEMVVNFCQFYCEFFTQTKRKVRRKFRIQ